MHKMRQGQAPRRGHAQEESEGTIGNHERLLTLVPEGKGSTHGRMKHFHRCGVEWRHAKADCSPYLDPFHPNP